MLQINAFENVGAALGLLSAVSTIMCNIYAYSHFQNEVMSQSIVKNCKKMYPEAFVFRMVAFV